jgi:hypothetical protein
MKIVYLNGIRGILFLLFSVVKSYIDRMIYVAATVALAAVVVAVAAAGLLWL